MKKKNSQINEDVELLVELGLQYKKGGKKAVMEFLVKEKGFSEKKAKQIYGLVLLSGVIDIL